MGSLERRKQGGYVMNYSLIPTDDYKEACDAIRRKTGKADLIKSSEMATEINGIMAAQYVVGQPYEFTLLASAWNGTTYTLDITGYTIKNTPQIGLPLINDYANTRAVVEAALTIPQASGTTVIISAVKTPTVDIKIAIFGLAVEGA